MTAFGEAELIRIPMPDGTYRDYSILDLLGAGHTQLQSSRGFGVPPIRIIEQRGPLQHGATTIDYRYNTRIIQVEVSERLACTLDMADRRFDLVDLLRPSRSFLPDTCPKPLIYRKWLPGGKTIQGTDLVLVAGSDIVHSVTGRFVHYGLLRGCQFIIDGSVGDDGTYTVVQVNHDGSVQISAAMAGTETGVHYTYRSLPTPRDLYCILELGPAWDRQGEDKRGYIEALRFVASDPFWYGPEQVQEWTLATDIDNLTFDFGDGGVGVDAERAWFGLTGGAGLWQFGNNYVSSSISVPYWGHRPAAPVIIIDGPLQDLILTNAATDTTLTFNYSVAPGIQVQIDTLNLTAYDDNDPPNDLFLYLTGDLSGFIITPDARNDRVNQLEIAFGAASPATGVQVVWRNRYLNA